MLALPPPMVGFLVVVVAAPSTVVPSTLVAALTIPPPTLALLPAPADAIDTPDLAVVPPPGVVVVSTAWLIPTVVAAAAPLAAVLAAAPLPPGRPGAVVCGSTAVEAVMMLPTMGMAEPPVLRPPGIAAPLPEPPPADPPPPEVSVAAVDVAGLLKNKKYAPISKAAMPRNISAFFMIVVKDLLCERGAVRLRRQGQWLYAGCYLVVQLLWVLLQQCL